MTMSARLPFDARRVQEALDRSGFPFQVVEMPKSTATAREAASAIGCTVGQIAKSIIFRGALTGGAILVVASGSNRIDEEAVAALAGEPLAQASRAFVREATGYDIGGVPPIGHAAPLQTWIDQDLLQYDTVWAAAGTPFSVFSLDPRLLVQMTGGATVRVRRG